LQSLEDRLAPATFTVTTRLDSIAGDGKLSLREAITRANTTPGPDTIILPARVYKITLGAPQQDDFFNLAGDFDIHDGVTIRGASAGSTIIDGNQIDRVFDIYGSGPSSIKVTLQGLTIRGGANQPYIGGGGILVGNADLIVKNCVITDNRTAFKGGGITNAYAPGTGNVTLIRTTVSRNVADSSGGGLYVAPDAGGQGSTLTVKSSRVRDNLATTGGGIFAGTVTLTNSTVSGNLGVAAGGIFAGTATLTDSTVRDNFGSSGGGIAANTVTLTNSTVSGNTAKDVGGGINAGTVTLTNSTVRGNVASTDGGGIRASTANLTGSTVTGNHAFNGGGIEAIDLTVTASTVSGNTAFQDGGGIRTGFGSVFLVNTTISGNHALRGGGIYTPAGGSLVHVTITLNFAGTGGGVFRAPGGSAPLSVKNSIIAQNFDWSTTDAPAPDVNGAFNSLGYNLIGVVDPFTGNGFGMNDFWGLADNPLDPMLGPLAKNGGRTLTHALRRGSPAIDKGDNAGAPATDQRGKPRIKDGDGNGSRIFDIGAFER
jgi:predicted outer membrane repeat protein